MQSTIEEKVSKINLILETTMLRLSIILISNVNHTSLFTLGEKLVSEYCDELSDGGFWVWNHKTDEVYYSPKFCTILGYNYGELGKGFAGFNRGNLKQMKRGIDIIQTLIDTQSHDTFVNIIEFTKKDGGIILIECSGGILFIDNIPFVVLGTHKIK